tara:strand:- start:8628 stop:8954 length:327 start_codon:yes stop_codon:yes gene_type:complete
MATKEGNLKHRYGITLVDYNDMRSKQNYQCKICCIETSDLVVDHCHNSGDVRGLLCANCNAGLGFFQDSPERMEKAAQYLVETKKKKAPPVLSPTISGGHAKNKSRAA